MAALPAPAQNAIAVSVRSASKCYRVFESQRARLRHALWPSSQAGVTEVWALRDVTFDIRHGESVAIIGRNGSGKSTLLELITGTLTPTAGTLGINGRVAALLELGSGFNPEYSGRENVMLNGLLLGLTRAEVSARFGEIAAFADIGEVLERPVKTYSSGMLVRLAFAVQVALRPNILIVDEALSVGDFFFQQKCLARIRELQASGTTILFVSHDMGTVRDLCDRALYLRHGELQFDGRSSEAIRQFMSERNNSPQSTRSRETNIASPVRSNESLSDIYRDAIWRTNSRDREKGGLLALCLYDAQGQPSTSFRMGERMRVVVAYYPHPEYLCHVTVGITNKYGKLCTATGTSQLRLDVPGIEDHRGPLMLDLCIELLLEAGNYSIAAVLGYLTTPNAGEQLDVTPQLGPIQLLWDYEHEAAPFLGQMGLPTSGKIGACDESDDR